MKAAGFAKIWSRRTVWMERLKLHSSGRMIAEHTAIHLRTSGLTGGQDFLDSCQVGPHLGLPPLVGISGELRICRNLDDGSDGESASGRSRFKPVCGAA